MFLAKAKSPCLLVSLPTLHTVSPSLICPDASPSRHDCISMAEVPGWLCMQLYPACMDTFRKHLCRAASDGWVSLLRWRRVQHFCHPVPEPWRSGQSESETQWTLSKVRIQGRQPMMAPVQWQNCQFAPSCAGIVQPLGLILKEMCTHCAGELQRKLLLQGTALAAR